MRLYDTAARAVRTLEPGGDTVSMYVCGITPYDSAHLGHAFTYHVFDVLTRRLLADGIGVRSVRNITDADDDIFRVARQRGLEWRTLIEEQVARFDREMAAIRILPVSAAPRASSHVAAMVDRIKELLEAGFAYVEDGWVYFEVGRYPDWGRLSGLGREAMLALSRSRGADPDDRRKRDPLDFVLWQPSLPDEPRWPAPWGEGRPGWHIECTVLARSFCGEPVDVHGGGHDLLFPHHECELAQARAGRDVVFVRHWVHVAMVGFGGEKMSKSLGNLVFVGDLLQQAPPGAIRLLLATHHYRSPWEYQAAELSDAVHRHRSLVTVAAGGARVDPDTAADLESRVLARLDDDLDTPGALAGIEELSRLAKPGTSTGVPVGPLLRRLAGLVGIDLGPPVVDPEGVAPLGSTGVQAP